MPLGSPELPITQAEADRAQLRRALQQAQERTLNQVEPGRSQESVEEETSPQVQGVEGVSGGTIQGENRGAHSFNLSKDEAEEEKKKEAPPKTPPDPQGRGRHLDLQG